MDFVLANCTHAVSFSAKHRSLKGRTKTVRGRKHRFSVIRVSNSAAEFSGSKVASSGDKKDWQVAKSSTALELLDIERGVCIPFRKYSPETVRIF